jgi:hypothetical protein
MLHDVSSWPILAYPGLSHLIGCDIGAACETIRASCAASHERRTLRAESATNVPSRAPRLVES